MVTMMFLAFVFVWVTTAMFNLKVNSNVGWFLNVLWVGGIILLDFMVLAAMVALWGAQNGRW